jgi:two-component system, chemotaxis family, protein-glutamate methylesterase/glutaminase
MPNSPRIRVLIVDDSAIVRKILTDALSTEPDLEVVGTAPDPYVARDKILALKPDVLTLDIEMPRMDGLTFLRKLMRSHPLPVVVISSLAQSSCRAAVQALEFGAVEVLAKPAGPYSVDELRQTLASKIRAAAVARLKLPGSLPEPPPSRLPIGLAGLSPDAVIAIGASTGGTEAIASILKAFPAKTPPILIAQHIPAQFSKAFAARLNGLCAVEVKEAADGDELRHGLVLIAPGDYHMLLRRYAGRYVVEVKPGPRVCYQRPSVDVLFFSAAEAAGSQATGVLLTGMGSDGAKGLLKMRQAGARTLVQDEATCVVFGMPREAIALGAAEEVHPLQAMAQVILSARTDNIVGSRGASTRACSVHTHVNAS